MKLYLIIPLLLIGCSPLKQGQYTSQYYAEHTHYVWCRGELNYCFDQVVPQSFCARPNNAKPVNWHIVAVGTNAPTITKEGDGYSFWIVCDNER